MISLKKITNKQILLVLSASLLVMILVALSHSWSFPDTDWKVEKGQKVLMTGSGVEETFTTARDGLSDIRVLFGGSRLGGGGTLRFSILDATCTETIRSTDLHITSLGSDDTTTFSFPRIADSNGKTYCLHLAYEPNGGTHGAVALFLISTVGPTQGSHLSIDDVDQPGLSLPLRPSYRSASLYGDLRELDQRISQYKPWFLKGALIATIGFLSILLSLGIVVIVALI